MVQAAWAICRTFKFIDHSGLASSILKHQRGTKHKDMTDMTVFIGNDLMDIKITSRPVFFGLQVYAILCRRSVRSVDIILPSPTTVHLVFSGCTWAYLLLSLARRIIVRSYG